MVTIRSYTTIEQSRKLEKILPLESADMYWAQDANIIVAEPYISKTEDETLIPAYKGAIPAWSLAALLYLFRISLNALRDGKWNAAAQCDGMMLYENKDNPVDACCELILKLHELNLLWLWN